MVGPVESSKGFPYDRQVPDKKLVVKMKLIGEIVWCVKC